MEILKENKIKKDAKVIFSPQLANYLLNNGFKIIKLKPKHNNPNDTVFVFKLEENLLDCITEWTNQKNNT